MWALSREELTGGLQTGGKAWDGGGDRGRRVQTACLTSYLVMALPSGGRKLFPVTAMVSSWLLNTKFNWVPVPTT